jgi:hypothetical protein
VGGLQGAFEPLLDAGVQPGKCAPALRAHHVVGALLLYRHADQTTPLPQVYRVCNIPRVQLSFEQSPIEKEGTR